MVAERDMPAKQWTMTLQFDNLALSVERENSKLVKSSSTVKLHTKHEVISLAHLKR